MFDPPKRTGLRALARLHRLDVQALITLLAIYLRWYAHLSEKTGALTAELLEARFRRRALSKCSAALDAAVPEADTPDHLSARLGELEEREVFLEGEQRATERLREAYEKNVGAVLRVLDLRRTELAVGNVPYDGMVRS